MCIPKGLSNNITAIIFLFSLTLVSMISTQRVYPRSLLHSNQRNLGRIPWRMGDDVRDARRRGTITIINNSNQLIKARCDNGGSGSLYDIHPHGGKESWFRSSGAICRICAYSSWHDYVLEGGTVLVLNHDFQFIKNGHWLGNARVSGPHL